jgi:hypothetical protein
LADEIVQCYDGLKYLPADSDQLSLTKEEGLKEIEDISVRASQRQYLLSGTLAALCFMHVYQINVNCTENSPAPHSLHRLRVYTDHG